jgi:orotate phosphoribosyltransferase
VATAAASLDAAKRARLVDLLREKSFERRKITLASGRESNFFVDCKQTVLTAEGHSLAGELMFALLSDLPECDAVAGVELGGCPLASAVSLISHQRGTPKKDHGTTKLVEGDKSITPGLCVALLEDVVTTGGSSLKAVEALRAAGVTVVGIVAVVDRQEGGRGEHQGRRVAPRRDRDEKRLHE